ncbi:MAG: hypothetical protein GY870_21720 [archaeon]|nr:hypothetical protein [archaeon]
MKNKIATIKLDRSKRTISISSEEIQQVLEEYYLIFSILVQKFPLVSLGQQAGNFFYC